MAQTPSLLPAPGKPRLRAATRASQTGILCVSVWGVCAARPTTLQKQTATQTNKQTKHTPLSESRVPESDGADLASPSYPRFLPVPCLYTHTRIHTPSLTTHPNFCNATRPNPASSSLPQPGALCFFPILASPAALAAFPRKRRPLPRQGRVLQQAPRFSLSLSLPACLSSTCGWGRPLPSLSSPGRPDGGGDVRSQPDSGGVREGLSPTPKSSGSRSSARSGAGPRSSHRPWGLRSPAGPRSPASALLPAGPAGEDGREPGRRRRRRKPRPPPPGSQWAGGPSLPGGRAGEAAAAAVEEASWNPSSGRRGM